MRDFRRASDDEEPELGASSGRCPSTDQLDKYDSDELDEAEEQAISAHLSQCGECCDYLYADHGFSVGSFPIPRAGDSVDE